jgi:hypothetical protein
LVEQRIENPRVAGSIPALGTAGKILDRLFTEQARGQLEGQLARKLTLGIRLAALAPFVGFMLTTTGSAAMAASAPPIRQRVEALERSHDTILNHYEVGLAFIGVLLTLVGILFPIVIYFTTILPTKREVEKVVDLENRLEDKFNRFLQSVEARRFNLLIERATGADPDARRDAATRLTMEDNSELTEQHIAALRSAIEDEKDLNIRSYLTHAALSKPTRHGDRIVRDIMGGGFSVLLGRALSYIAHNPRPELEALISRKIEGANDVVQESVQLLGAALINHEAMTYLLRLPVWRTATNRADRARMLATLNAWVTSGFISKEDLRSSAFADAMGTSVLFSSVVDGKIVMSEQPDGATSAQVFEDGVIKKMSVPGQDEFRALVEKAKASSGPESE